MSADEQQVFEALRALQIENAKLREHIDKLVVIFEDAKPCSDHCDLGAILSWVDPADKQRVAELRDKLREAIVESCRVTEANGRRYCNICDHTIENCDDISPESGFDPAIDKVCPGKILRDALKF